MEQRKYSDASDREWQEFRREQRRRDAIAFTLLPALLSALARPKTRAPAND